MKSVLTLRRARSWLLPELGSPSKMINKAAQADTPIDFSLTGKLGLTRITYYSAVKKYKRMFDKGRNPDIEN